MAESCDAVGCREDEEHSHHVTAILLSAGLQFLLWLTEVLTAVNIDTRRMPWTAAFSPLYLLALVSVPACIWGCWRKRRVEVREKVEVKGEGGGEREGGGRVSTM